MTQLYHTATTAPAKLPHYHRDETGKLHSALSEKTEAVLAAFGFFPTPDKPTYDPVTQRVVWDQQAQDWAVEDLPQETLAEAKLRRHGELAARRWDAENGGMVFGGTPVATDDRSKALIYGASGRAVPNFKVAPGVFISLTDVETAALAEAMASHVQACFDNEAALAALIEAATTIVAVEAVDLETGWPA